MITRSPFPDIDVPQVPLFDYVFARAEEFADKAAMIDGPSGRIVTYGALESQVRALAGGLLERGFAKGTVVAIMALNSPEYAVVFHGVAMAGGVVTTLNPTYTDREVHHQLVDSGASILVTIAPFLATALAGAVGTAVRETFTFGESDAASVMSLRGEPLADHVPCDLDDVVVLPYSSGTTGVAKGVMLTHRNLVSNLAQTLFVADVSDDEVVIAVLPFFHIYGMQILMNGPLVIGATVVTQPRFDLEEFLRLHQDHAVTRSYVAPPIVVAFAKHPMVDRFDLSSLRHVFSAAAPLSAELAIEAGTRLGCEVSQGYGMTELSPATHLTPNGQFKPGSVGVTIPNTETRIVDPATGSDLGIDADGEVWVRGPQVMKGYLNNPEATALTIDRDGWLHTGDIGHFDTEGHLYIVDRLKELIKYKGFQVAPAELEALLLTHPAVADAAVIGLADPEAGEVPGGYVVLKPGQAATGEDLMAFIADRVAHYKQIRTITFMDEIPKSASGKILRRVLRDRVTPAT